jgi:trimethyllysine dioxygenase
LQHDGTGGESLYVDGFAVAQELKSNHRWAYDALASIKIMAHCAGDKSTLIQPQEKFPVLKLIDGELVQIRYNDHDRSLLELEDQEVELFYCALHEWKKLLCSKNFDFWIKLKPGTAVMVNNWRVFHGRSSFTGLRRLVGSYHSYDDYQSKIKTMLGIEQRYRI